AEEPRGAGRDGLRAGRHAGDAVIPGEPTSDQATRVEKNRTVVELVIEADELNHAEVGTTIGAKPTKTWKKGDLVERSLIRYKRDGWLWSVELVGVAEASVGLDRFIDEIGDER